MSLFVFFRHCATFFEKLFCLRRFPFLVFLLFKGSLQDWMSVKGSPFQFFLALCDFFSIFFQGSPIQFYLSLIYSTDLRRSRLVYSYYVRNASCKNRSKSDFPILQSGHRKCRPNLLIRCLFGQCLLRKSSGIVSESKR